MVTVWTKQDNYAKNDDVNVVVTVDNRHSNVNFVHVGLYDGKGVDILVPPMYLPFDSTTSNKISWWIPCYQFFSSNGSKYDIQALYPDEPDGNKIIQHADHNQ